MPRRTIVDEIKQTRPFRSRSQEAVVALLHTANLVRRRAEAAVQAEEITFQQYNVLRILRGAKGPLPTMEIAERLIEQAPGITRHVNNLESRGLLRREQWPGDRRQVLCQITPSGLRVLAALEEAINAVDESLAASLSESQLTQLIELLELIRSNEPSS